MEDNIQDKQVETNIVSKIADNEIDLGSNNAKEDVATTDDKIEDAQINYFGVKLDKLGEQILENAEENDAYKFKLQNFDGPLDLLLHLIQVAKVDIRDIFVSQITEQYMQYMDDIENIDVDKAAEFISMAATLLEIKSKKLLPKLVEENSEEEDPEQRLIRQIEEYKLFKNATEKLKEIEDVNRLYKQPDDSVGDYRYELPDKLDLEILTQAFYNLLQRQTIKAQEITERKIVKDRFTVAQKISQIKDDLITKNHFKFNELFEDDYSKSEIINTFLAILELLKGQFITATQTATYGEIEIFKKEEN